MTYLFLTRTTKKAPINTAGKKCHTCSFIMKTTKNNPKLVLAHFLKLVDLDRFMNKQLNIKQNRMSPK